MDSVIQQLESLKEEETLRLAKDLLPGLRASMSGSGWEREIHLDPDGKHEITAVMYVYEYGRFIAVRVMTESINWRGFRRDSHLLIG